MIKGKTVITWVLAVAVLAGLGGCGKSAQIDSAESIVSGLSTSDRSAASAASRPSEQETGWFGEGPLINVAYTRASLSENPVTSYDDYYSTIKDWINLYIIGNYNAFSSLFNPSYSEICYTLETMTGEKEHFSTLICETDFKSNMAPAGLKLYDGRYQIKFQMVVKTSEIYNEGPFTLIGFVTNQDRQIVEARELYDFIKGVPRYQDTDFIAPEPMKLIQLASLGYDFTEKRVDDGSGLSVVNLRALTEGLKVDDFSFFPGDLLAILAVNPEVQNEKVLMVYKADDLRLLYRKAFSYPSGEYPVGGHVEFDYINGTLVLEQKLGEENYKYFILTEGGISEISKPLTRYRLSDTATIVDEKNCLYLEQNGVRKLLLEGIYEEDSTDWENYNFFCRISDTRFIYEKYGYEWYDECGIYDIETGKKTVFTHVNAPLLNIVSYKDGKAVLVADEWSDYDSYGPYLYNESTRELTDLDLLDIIPDESAIRPRFCLFGNTLAVFIEDNPFTTFSLYDVSSRLEIMNLNLFYARGYAQNYSHYSNGLNATKNYIWFNSDSEFPSDYLLRIPKKR
ncbi:MAG TPA: hypothetical protein PK854_04680 [Oscillospiraceae bacterium]|nr:hypothetical protein [Oscillospiraceae bacterium]HPS34542.1 hypothetical protein [Oscillospiraceae bacterium]